MLNGCLNYVRFFSEAYNLLSKVAYREFRKNFFWRSVVFFIMWNSGISDAQVVYNDFIPDRNFVLQNNTNRSELIPIDINNDAVVDFNFRYNVVGSSQYDIHILPLNDNQVLMKTTQNAGVNYAEVLLSGQSISSSVTGSQQWGTVATHGPLLTDNALANFATGQDAFIGIRLKNGAQWNYGWIRVELSSGYPIIATVRSVSYEATSNQAISVPTYGTLSSSSLTTTIDLGQGEELEVTVPSTLTYCGNTLQLTLSNSPAYDVTIYLNDVFVSSGHRMMEFFESGNIVHSVTFPASTSTLTRSLTFSAFKY
jgi:hypothetical protein